MAWQNRKASSDQDTHVLLQIEEITKSLNGLWDRMDKLGQQQKELMDQMKGDEARGTAQQAHNAFYIERIDRTVQTIKSSVNYVILRLDNDVFAESTDSHSNATKFEGGHE